MSARLLVAPTGVCREVWSACSPPAERHPVTPREKIAPPAGWISQLRITAGARVRALVDGPRLDSELAEGVSPSASAAHLARADAITRPQARRRIAAALNRAIEECFAPARRGTAEAPLGVSGIRCCRGQLLTLVRPSVPPENPRRPPVGN